MQLPIFIESLRFTMLRRLRRTPGFTWSVTLVAAVGIGLASATGAIARAVAFAGLPVRDAARVVVLWGVDRAGSFPHMPLAPNDIPALAEAMRGVATIAAGDYNGSYPWPFASIDGTGEPLRLRGTLAGGNYFDVLGARPLIGRALRREDDVIGAPRVMVLSYAAWRRHFGSDPHVIGRALHAVIWGASYTIVGVMPPGLDVPREVEFWTAFTPTAARNGSLEDSWFNVDVFARLAPGATTEQARQILTSYYANLARAGHSQWSGARATVRTLPQLVTGDVRPAFTALAAAAAIVLLTTCGNVAGLLLVRASARRRELAVRAALGAGRVRLAAELLAEHASLAALGGIGGMVIAAAIVRAFVALAPPELPRVADLGVDWAMLAVVLGVTAIVMLVVGIAPAIAASRVPAADALGGAREGAGGRVSEVRMRRLIVGVQVALALVVLSAASLVGRSLLHLTQLDLGMANPETLEFVELVPSGSENGSSKTAQSQSDELSRWWTKQDAIMQRVGSAPGIVAVAPVVHEPFAGAGGWDARVEAEGASPRESARHPYVNMEVTNADYLRVMHIKLLRGRWLGESDRSDAQRVVVLSERAARALFPDGKDLGRRVRLDKLWATVVGVVADTRFREFLEARPSIYIPYRQFDAGAGFLAIRTQGAPAGVAAAVRRAVAEFAPTMLVQDHGTMSGRLAEPLARPRLLAGILAAYATVVVTLAVAGLYAVVAGSVASRRREFGVRVALGATSQSLMSLVLGEGLRVAIAGALVGLVAALAVSRLTAALLYGVSPKDPGTLIAAALALLGVCVLAVVFPARRAARVDPASALRAE
jgi:predicted permease